MDAKSTQPASVQVGPLGKTCDSSTAIIKTAGAMEGKKDSQVAFSEPLIQEATTPAVAQRSVRPEVQRASKFLVQVFMHHRTAKKASLYLFTYDGNMFQCCVL